MLLLSRSDENAEGGDINVEKLGLWGETKPGRKTWWGKRIHLSKVNLVLLAAGGCPPSLLV